MELLDFSGGPWLLRNGEKVSNLKFVNGHYEGSEFNVYWNMFGEADSQGIMVPEWDIMENLDNWKYNRGNNNA